MQMADRIVMRSVEPLIPYARNARTHSDEQVAQIAGSIREFGFTNPLLLDGANGILAGQRGSIGRGRPCSTHFSAPARRAPADRHDRSSIPSGPSARRNSRAGRFLARAATVAKSGLSARSFDPATSQKRRQCRQAVESLLASGDAGAVVKLAGSVENPFAVGAAAALRS
jgi:hypothetical protein